MRESSGLNLANTSKESEEHYVHADVFVYLCISKHLGQHLSGKRGNECHNYQHSVIKASPVKVNMAHLSVFLRKRIKQRRLQAAKAQQQKPHGRSIRF